MKIDNRDIYEQIGNLFYAIAADQHVKPLEVAELKLLVTREWLPRNAQESEFPLSIEAHSILLAMDTMQANQTRAAHAYQEFARFFELHPEVFTTELKNNIYHTASEIVKIFKADSAHANVHLKALRKLLDLQTSAVQ